MSASRLGVMPGKRAGTDRSRFEYLSGGYAYNGKQRRDPVAEAAADAADPVPCLPADRNASAAEARREEFGRLRAEDMPVAEAAREIGISLSTARRYERALREAGR